MKLFGIFGNPVSHSISPLLHNLALRGLGLDGIYTRLQIDNPTTLKNQFQKYSFDGVNVTVPHKEIAYELCDEICGIAQDIRAVNTIVNIDNQLVGFNTDAFGFFESIKDFKIRNVLILGAGGTAKALAFVLRENNIDVTILNRSSNRLQSFKENNFKTYSWDDFEVAQYDMIVNTTSAGMSDDSLPLDKQILVQLFRQSEYAFDVIYNVKTPFLKLAAKYVITKNGKEMLLNQAVLAFNLFYNKRYKNNDIKKYMEQAFDL